MCVSMHADKIQDIRRPEKETRITHAQHETRAPRRQRGMAEVQRISVKVLPIVVVNQRLKLLELWRAGIRRQDFEVREG